VKLAGAATAVAMPLVISHPEMLTVSAAAAHSGITEKTIGGAALPLSQFCTCWRETPN
jgi:hypothetical protein